MKQSIILSGQKVAGWPKPGKKLRALPTDELKKILATHWREDTHFCQYAVIPEIGSYRYNNEIFKSPEFEEVRRAGGAIDMVALAFDVDSPAKKSPEPGAIDEWFDLERPKIANLLRAFPGGLAWRTKGGWRVVWYTNFRIFTADDILVWKKNYLSAIVYIEREFNIIADAACNDWNRLHRVPFGIRENEPNFGFGEPVIRETFGELTGSVDLVTLASDADRTEARRRFLSAWREPPAKTDKQKSKADENPAPMLSTAGVWERALRSRNAIIRELGPGKWAIVCANAAKHTTRGNETSTVLYAPGAGEVQGHIYCSHSHCNSIDWKQAWSISNEEWAVLTREATSEAVTEEQATSVAAPPCDRQDSTEELERLAISNLTPDKTGLPAPIPGNIVNLLTNHPTWKDCLVYDTFKHERFWKSVPAPLIGGHKYDKRITELDIIRIHHWLNQGSRNRPSIPASIENVRLGIVGAAEVNEFDSLQAHVLKFKSVWDGTPRLDSWLIDYMGAEDNELNRVIGKRWLIACVARALHPGIVADMMPILEGKQEIGKNFMLEIMFTQEFISMPFGAKVGSKDFDQKIADSWCAHDDELCCMLDSKLEIVKSWLTQKTAKFRKAYDRDFTNVPRRFVPIGSTNQNKYLVDNENRRFWPVHVTQLRHQELMRDRDQIWAEAFAYYQLGNTDWRITKYDPVWPLLEQAHGERKNFDPLDERIVDLLANGQVKIPFRLVDLFGCLGFVDDKLASDKLVKQVTSSLRKLKLDVRVLKVAGINTRLWGFTSDEAQELVMRRIQH